MREEVIEIVREASKIMKRDDIEVTQKGNGSNFVTSKDLAVQNFLSEKLLTLLPNSKMVGEEKEESWNNKGLVWIVDPIDGTSNFIRDIGLSVISVALYDGTEGKLGVVYNPYRDEMFSAEAGKGAFLNERPIHVSSRDFSHAHLCSAMSLYDKRFAKPCFNIIEKVYYESDDLRRLGSAALELSYLAAGRVELYFEIRVSSWDVAAAMVLIKEAGGFVKVLYEDELPINHPFAIYGANSRDNFKRLEGIVKEEIPEKLDYCGGKK